MSENNAGGILPKNTKFEKPKSDSPLTHESMVNQLLSDQENRLNDLQIEIDYVIAGRADDKRKINSPSALTWINTIIIIGIVFVNWPV